VDVVLAEEHLTEGDVAATSVAANRLAVTEAVATATSALLSVEILCRWHRSLMGGSPTPERHVAVLRHEQGWMAGPTRPTPISSPPARPARAAPR